MFKIELGARIIPDVKLLRSKETEKKGTEDVASAGIVQKPLSTYAR